MPKAFEGFFKDPKIKEHVKKNPKLMEAFAETVHETEKDKQNTDLVSSVIGIHGPRQYSGKYYFKLIDHLDRRMVVLLICLLIAFAIFKFVWDWRQLERELYPEKPLKHQVR